MGLNEPRTPAVHRAIRLLDAIWSGHADTPAALAETLGLAKSSVADLLQAMDDERLVTRSPDGRLHTGERWATLADPYRVVDRLLRACARTPDLDGHTIAIGQLFGAQMVYLDIRPGRHPLPLTPRPGQSFPAATSAGAIAVLSSLTASTAAQIVREASGHQGLDEHQLAETLALRGAQRKSVLELHSPDIGRQVACAVPGTRIALIMHIPERLSDPAFIRRAAGALTSAANQVHGQTRSRTVV